MEQKPRERERQRQNETFAFAIDSNDEEIDVERKIAWPHDYWMRKEDYNNKIYNVKWKTYEKHTHSLT